MTAANENEEIIELTEVIEEGIGKITPEPLREPKGEERGEPKAIPDFPAEPRIELKKIWELDRAREPAPKIEGKAPPIPPPIPEPSRPPIRHYASEAQAMRETLKASVEEWMASEGVRILERVAREIFPPIAEEILRKEIEKLKGKVEEKE